MNPIAIFRYASTESPGYLAEFLDERNIPWKLIRIDAGEAVPQNASAYSGLVFMGGPMSVNDDLPWIPKVEMLIRDAVARDIPRSVEQLTELVGRMSLKDIVRESTDLVERLCIEAALAFTSDNRASAAEILGVSRQSLYSKLHRHGLGNLVSGDD